MIPHLAVPFRIGAQGAAVVDDGSLDEVEQNVRVIVGTIRGERLVQPDFGIDDPVFGNVNQLPDIAAIQAAIEEWDERATVDIVKSVDGTTVNLALRVGMIE